jgi:hypothetical protein
VSTLDGYRGQWESKDSQKKGQKTRICRYKERHNRLHQKRRDSLKNLCEAAEKEQCSGERTVGAEAVLLWL